MGQPGKSWLSFTLFCGYLITYFNSFTNAVVFLATFKRSKEKMILFFKDNSLRKFKRVNIVDVDESNRRCEYKAKGLAANKDQ